MYSMSWFEAFARNAPRATIDAEIAGIAGLAPPEEFTRLLDVGCGIGRTAGLLAARGYAVTGIDTNIDAVRAARHAAPGARYVALDQRHIGRLRWVFDAAIILWNSIGFSTREDDLTTLHGIASVLRPGGKLLLDLYHPDWLSAQPRETVTEAGVTIRRWVEGGRCFHAISYPGGAADEIQFNVYRPEQMKALLGSAGLLVGPDLVWWSPEREAGVGYARYQLACTRPGSDRVQR